MRPIVAVKIHSGGKSWTSYALLDTGANTCAINRRIATIMNLEIRTEYKKLYTFDKASYGSREIASFIVTDMEEKIKLEIINALVGDIMTTESETPCPKDAIKQFDHMKDVTLHELEDPTIGLLLSSKFSRHYFGKETRIGPEDEPIGVLTDFGWSVIGPSPDRDEEIDELHLNAICEEENVALNDMIKMMFQHDFISRLDEDYPPEMKHPSQDDQYSLQQMKESIMFNQETGHYCVSVPWKNGREKTAEQFSKVNFLSYTRNRQRKLKEKLERDPILLEGSFKQMEEQVELGHVRIIPNHNADPESPVCYLANHIVTYEDKPGKFRITQDGAAKTQGTSLNKAVLTGPDFMSKLIGIVMRFRRNAVVLSADIKSFFFQIEMSIKDAPAGRHLWWTDRSMKKEIILEPRTFNMGLASSPTASAFTLQYHALQVKSMYELDIFIAIMSQFYVDDYLDSVRTVEEGRKRKKNMKEALKLGGFDLIKWKSNIEELNDEPTTPTPPPHPEEPTTDPNPEEFDDYEDDYDIDEMADENVNNKERENPTPEQIKAALNKTTETGKLSDLTSSTVNSKILGIGYDYKSDCMFIKIGSKLNRTVKTKRQLLSFVSSMYDPLGIIAPFILKGRLFFQKVNECEISWNDTVPDSILKPFNKWKQTVNSLKNIQIPRWTASLGMEDCVSELIITSDASSIGYGIACYIRRHLKGDNKAHLYFILGKSHVVPASMQKNFINRQLIHMDSIPRLELMAALLAAIWRDIIIRESGEEFAEVIIFCDSTTVLGWIRDWHRKFSTFENFRLKRIRLLSKVSEWYYIASKSNPADLASKGLNADDQKGWSFFHSGPPFLTQERSKWNELNPQPGHLQEPLPSIAEVALVAPIFLMAIGSTEKDPEISIENDENIEESWPTKATANLSIWSSKIRRICLIVKVLQTLKEKVRAKQIGASLPRLRPRKNKEKTKIETKQETKRIYFTMEEKSNGEMLLIRAIQSNSFQKEITSLIKLDIFSPNAYNELKDKKSKLISLSPFIDNQGIMRAGGRLEKSKTLPFDTKFPIILPRADNENVSTLIRHVHAKNYHCSGIETFYILRQKYFPLGGRANVLKITSRCLQCQKTGKRPKNQRIAPLPSDRLDIVIPFHVSGVDVFGEFNLTQGRRPKKRWVLLLTCLTTRAVALYPLKDMSLSTTINALVKFNSQFPALKKLVSDNGTNFKGANREMKEAIAGWNKEELTDRLADIGIDWQFGPAKCGHFGGSWERLIQVVKKCLYACIGKKVIDIDTFDTICAGVMGCVNRRPLTKAGANISEPLVLSPAHFLYPHNFVNSAPSICPPIRDGNHLRSSWNQTRILLDDFFQRFKTEYVTSLLERKKWTTSTLNVRVGDLALLVEDLCPREKWRVCRITEIVEEDDNRIRRVKLRDSNGTMFDRHVNAIVTLELD